ncbi:hypothetical protein T08_2149 [Trichinella sp. T8]|nr:hypothetical protein T08_2149 [Trichinella sp. T8]
MYSASTVDSAIVFCTLDDHAIGPLQNVIMYPTVDRRLSASPAQSVSQKAIILDFQQTERLSILQKRCPVGCSSSEKLEIQQQLDMVSVASDFFHRHWMVPYHLAVLLKDRPELQLTYSFPY